MAESDSTGNSEALQLGDVLQGAGGNADNVAAYLHFTYDAESNATVIEVKSEAEAAGQKIVLAGINLTSLGSDSAIISHLLSSTSQADS
jgi:hypothetical protein